MRMARLTEMTEINDRDRRRVMLHLPSMCGLSAARGPAVGPFWESAKGEIITHHKSDQISLGLKKKTKKKKDFTMLRFLPLHCRLREMKRTAGDG